MTGEVIDLAGRRAQRPPPVQACDVPATVPADVSDRAVSFFFLLDDTADLLERAGDMPAADLREACAIQAAAIRELLTSDVRAGTQPQN